MVFVATAVEYDFFNAGCLGAFSDELTNLGCFGFLVAFYCCHNLLHGRCGGKGVTSGIVDHLHMHVPSRTEHSQPRCFGGAAQGLANADVTAHPSLAATSRDIFADRQPLLVVVVAHVYLPVFPTLRRICSPS